MSSSTSCSVDQPPRLPNHGRDCTLCQPDSIQWRAATTSSHSARAPKRVCRRLTRIRCPGRTLHRRADCDLRVGV